MQPSHRYESGRSRVKWRYAADLSRGSLPSTALLDNSILLGISSSMAAKMDRLGELLADARGRRKLTLRAVQEAVGISNAYLSQLETGKVQSPSPVVLHKLSELYELPYETVMEAAGYPPPRNANPSGPTDRLAARIGKTTPDEEDALVEYLRFIRSQRNRRGRP
jgi:transcriptional regulator with XRE-family HTH domain